MRGARQSGLQAAICSINLRVLAGTQGRPLRRPRGCDKRAQNINADISIERIAKKGEKSPDFRVYHVTETSRAEIGAGWIEETQDHTRKYVSLGIDDIAFADKFLLPPG